MLEVWSGEQGCEIVMETVIEEGLYWLRPVPVLDKRGATDKRRLMTTGLREDAITAEFWVYAGLRTRLHLRLISAMAFGADRVDSCLALKIEVAESGLDCLRQLVANHAVRLRFRAMKEGQSYPIPGNTHNEVAPSTAGTQKDATNNTKEDKYLCDRIQGIDWAGVMMIYEK